MEVCLFFESDVAISRQCVAVYNEFNYPLHYIPYIKRYVKHFPLLQGVYVFVPLLRFVQFCARKHDAKDIDGIKPFHQG